MTLVVGIIDQANGAVYLGADSKVTWDQDETRTRRIYAAPALKVIRLAEDLAVGLAGDGPETLAAVVESLRGAQVEEVLQSLAKVKGSAFVVARISPAQLWSVTSEHGVEERTSIGRAWAGDGRAFSIFQEKFNDVLEEPMLDRFQSAMGHIIHLRKLPFVGGFAVTAVATADRGFYYLPTRSELWPESSGPTAVSEVEHNPDGTVSFKIRVPFNERPLVLQTIPGTDPTPGAIALWIENAHMGFLFCDGTSTSRLTIRARSAGEFTQEASTRYGQLLATTSPPG